MVDAIKNAPLDTVPTLEQTVERRLNHLDESAQTAIKALAVNEDALIVVTLQEACALDMDTVYAAVRQLTARNLAELATRGDGQTIVVGSHARLLTIIRDGLGQTANRVASCSHAHEATRVLEPSSPDTGLGPYEADGTIHRT